MRKIYSTLILFFILLNTSFAQIINVPADFPTIQQAIDYASAGDTILVAPGTYYENISFRGKGIVVASQYILANDTTFINTTIIDGSQPQHADTASCVRITSPVASTTQDSSAALIGFKLTGGKGTRWEDEHNPGSWYREGGGILIQYLSPRILHNHIVLNEANDKQNCTSAGGGGIRCGDGNPLIMNNIIEQNKGRYGGGIVLNFSGAVIKNNIISQNSGGEDYGGGGIWMYGQDVLARPRIVENNTIVYNTSVLGGGGIRIWSTTMILRNSVIWGNSAAVASQIQGTVTPSCCDIQGGFAGISIINEDPQFDMMNFYLSVNSPCIDAGDPAPEFYDVADPLYPGNALFPAMDSIRNDMGAYGGQGSAILGNIHSVLTAVENIRSNLHLSIYPDPFKDSITVKFDTESPSEATVSVIDAAGKVMFSEKRLFVRGDNKVVIPASSFPAGEYLIVIDSGNNKGVVKGIKTR